MMGEAIRKILVKFEQQQMMLQHFNKEQVFDAVVIKLSESKIDDPYQLLE
jgi:hypothetical protein